MTVTIKKSKRLRSKKDVAHKPSGRGKGKWHSRTTLWAYKRLMRRKAQVARRSRQINRQK